MLIRRHSAFSRCDFLIKYFDLLGHPRLGEEIYCFERNEICIGELHLLLRVRKLQNYALPTT